MFKMAVPIKAFFTYLNLSNFLVLHPVLIELTSKTMAGLDISFQGHSFISRVERKTVVTQTYF